MQRHQGFFIVHNFIDSTVHSRHLKSLGHCICTNSVTNIRPSRYSKPVPLRCSSYWKTINKQYSSIGSTFCVYQKWCRGLMKIWNRPIIMVGLRCYNQSGVAELLIMRDPHYGRMCFKSVKTLGALHSQLWKKPGPSASAFSTAKNVKLLRPYPICKRPLATFWVNAYARVKYKFDLSMAI